MLDLNEYIDQDQLLESSIEGLGAADTFNVFWDSLKNSLKNEYAVVEATPYADEEKPEVIANATAFTINLDDFLIAWCWCGKGDIFKEFSTITKGSTITLVSSYRPGTGLRTFTEFVTMIAFLKTLECKFILNVSMYLAPSALLFLDFVDEVNFGEHCVINLSGVFTNSNDIAPKYSSCVEEMNQMYEEIIIKHKLLTAEQLDNLKNKSHANVDTIYIADINYMKP